MFPILLRSLLNFPQNSSSNLSTMNLMLARVFERATYAQSSRDSS